MKPHYLKSATTKWKPLYVLTVPAIWDEFAKSVMAQAAVLAGAR